MYKIYVYAAKATATVSAFFGDLRDTAKASAKRGFYLANAATERKVEEAISDNYRKVEDYTDRIEDLNEAIATTRAEIDDMSDDLNKLALANEHAEREFNAQVEAI